jgi:hypothetical protein
MTDIYKQALCHFIQDGLLTLEQVQEKVAYLESTAVAKSRETPTWVAAEALCKRLNAGIVANSHKPFVMNVTAIAHMEKLLRIDKVSVEDAEQMIDWCLAHEFWGTVIFSPVKFRKHFNTMLIRRDADALKRSPVGYSLTPKVPPADQDFFERKRKEHEESVPMPKDFKRVLGLVHD